jgi:hypothetical protein
MKLLKPNKPHREWTVERLQSNLNMSPFTTYYELLCSMDRLQGQGRKENADRFTMQYKMLWSMEQEQEYGSDKPPMSCPSRARSCQGSPSLATLAVPKPNP